MSNFTDYSLPKNAYATFDALSLKQLFVDKLKTSGIFGDQSFEGNNFNSVLDVVASMYHILLFYLNQTSSETMFTQTTLWENMNKLVSSLGYKPTGRQTSVVDFKLTANANIPTGFYTIKPFSFTNVDGIQYTLLDTMTFEKTIDGEEEVSISKPFLHQGTLFEYPIYTALGEDYEIVFIAYDNFVDQPTDKFISDNTIRVFVKDKESGVWSKWEETRSLFFHSSKDKVYEKRLNENGRFELKFGNNINGKKLNAEDEVSIYFLVSIGSKGEIGANKLPIGKFYPFNSSRIQQIISDTLIDTNLLSNSQYTNLTLDNENQSTPVTQEESVQEMRQNVPLLFSQQNRLVTTGDYEAFISKNYNNIIASVSVANNDKFIHDYISYFYDLGLAKPNDDCRVLINQLNFQTTTNFNNVYGVMVPSIGAVRSDNYQLFVSLPQKQLIIDEVEKLKVCTQNFVPLDPVYYAFSPGLAFNGEDLLPEICTETFIVVKQNRDVQQSKEKIKADCFQIIQDYFSVNTCSLGQVVNLQQISDSILAIPGVSGLETRRVSENNTRTIQGINMLYWNPIYPADDINSTQQNVKLKFFQYPFLFNNELVNRIIIEDE
jgi:hypothetical protein